MKKRQCFWLFLLLLSALSVSRVFFVQAVKDQLWLELGFKNGKTKDVFMLRVPDKAKMKKTKVVTHDQTTEGKIERVTVADLRPLSPGWTLTLAISDFIDGPKKIGLENLTVSPGKIEAARGDLQGVHAGGEFTFSSGNDSAVLMWAEAGKGRGLYLQEENLKLKIPANTYAGSYKSTFVFTLQ
jgi:hypothetical protein